MKANRSDRRKNSTTTDFNLLSGLLLPKTTKQNKKPVKTDTEVNKDFYVETESEL